MLSPLSLLTLLTLLTVASMPFVQGTVLQQNGLVTLNMETTINFRAVLLFGRYVKGHVPLT